MMHIYTLFIHVGNSPTLPNKTTIYAAFSQCPGSCHSSKVEVLRGVRVRSLHHLPQSLANVTFFPNDSLFLLSNTIFPPKKVVYTLNFSARLSNDPSSKSLQKKPTKDQIPDYLAHYPSHISSTFQAQKLDFLPFSVGEMDGTFLIGG